MANANPDSIQVRRDKADMHPRRDNLELLFTVGIVALVVSVAVIMFVVADAHPDLLWRGYYHDRNGHYAFGQDLALAIRTFDPLWFFAEIVRANVWPPVHGLVLAAVLLIGGIDHRLGIVPSLIGWAITVVLVALIARRMFRNRDLGMTAAIVAVTLGIASPAFRLLACDVMLECLGAALSAAAVWAYGHAMAARESRVTAEQERSAWRVLAIILALLFFEKANYWGLTVAALGVTHLLNDAANNWRRGLAVAQWLVNQINVATIMRALRDPLIVAALAMGATVFYLFHRGPTSVVLFDRAVSIYPPDNLVTATYAVVFIRLALWWRDGRSTWDAVLGPAGRALFYWHCVPVAVSFLWPDRLSAFMWYVGPNNGNTSFDPWGGITLYWHAFAEGFSPTQWAAIATLGFFLIGLSRINSFPPGGRAVFILALVSFAGVVIHPQHQGRFLGSWIFAVWIGAGAGVAVLMDWAIPRRAWLPLGGAIGIAIAAALWRATPATAYPVAIYPTSGPSDLDLVRPVLPDIEGLSSIAYATTFGESKLVVWMMREHCRCKLEVESPRLTGLTREEVKTQMAAHLASWHVSAFVIFDAPGAPYEIPELGWTHNVSVGILDALAAQDRYVRVAVHTVPQFGAEVSVWRLRDTDDRAQSRAR